jgi:hypothetical protein
MCNVHCARTRCYLHYAHTRCREAEKAEEEAANAQNEPRLDDATDGEGGVLSQGDQQNNALVVINAIGIIQMANKVRLTSASLICRQTLRSTAVCLVVLSWNAVCCMAA